MPAIAWPRLVHAGDEPVAFVFAVRAVLDEARSRGNRSITVSWLPGPHSPEGFYRKLGFATTGQVLHGRTVGRMSV